MAAVEGDALQKIRAFVVVHFTHNAQNLVKMGVFFQDFRSLSGERRQIIVEERDMYDTFLRDLIRPGQEEGVVCPDIDPKLAAITILGMLNWIYHWYRPGGELAAVEIANAYGDFVVAGLACDPATHMPGHRRHSLRCRPGSRSSRRTARLQAGGKARAQEARHARRAEPSPADAQRPLNTGSRFSRMRRTTRADPRSGRSSRSRTPPTRASRRGRGAARRAGPT